MELATIGVCVPMVAIATLNWDWTATWPVLLGFCGLLLLFQGLGRDFSRLAAKFDADSRPAFTSVYLVTVLGAAFAALALIVPAVADLTPFTITGGQLCMLGFLTLMFGFAARRVTVFRRALTDDEAMADSRA
ncbi:hypothetical protein KDL45_04915 [bacterium]|nr:hypothetical protein [bacterium]